MTETEIWTKWESQVVNGIFPLRRFLGRSNHSVVFLTECRAQNLANAAIKIIPADPARAESQLARWQLAASLPHPRLIRLLETGRCKLGGHPFVFVVTEYSEQNLAQILPHRALTAEEVREMLTPALDALAFLHAQNLVHGQLKPPNFLVVNDQLKLASDTIRAARDTADLAGDMRCLGATIVEALTQTRPSLEGGADVPSLPATLSAELAHAVQRCLSSEPGNRPTVSELRNLIGPVSAAPPPASAPELAAAPLGAPHTPDPPALHNPQPRWLVPAAAVALVLLAVWGGSRMLRSHAAPARPIPDSIASEQTSAPAAAQSSVTAQSAMSPVVHQEMPAVSRGARDSIRGQIKVAVRVTVDRAGNVVGENLEMHGSSRYFARLATEAARKWTFAPSDSQSPREWLVEFEFSRNGVIGHAVPRAR
jgi:hypothetical protein